MELPGASLNVIGVHNNHAKPHEAEQVRSSDTLFALEFHRNILIPSIEGLSVKSKTRSNNLHHSNTLPVCFRIYEDDLPALSRSIETHVCYLRPQHNLPLLLCILQIWANEDHRSTQFYAVPELGHCSCRQVTHTWREYPRRTELFTQ